MTDFEIAMLALGTVVVLFGLASTVQSRRPSLASLGHPKERIDIIDDRLQAMETRLIQTDHHVANMRTILGALPSKDTVHKLEVDMTRLAGKVEVINTISVATGRAVDRIESHLIPKQVTS